MAILGALVGRCNTSSLDATEVSYDGIRQDTEEDQAELRAAINLQDTYEIADGIQVGVGIVAEEFISGPSERLEWEEDNLEIVPGEEGNISVNYGKFWFLEPNFILLEKKDMHKWAFDVFSFIDSISEVSGVRIDTQSLAEDYPEHWKGGFRERPGNVQSGTHYGTNMACFACG